MKWQLISFIFGAWGIFGFWSGKKYNQWESKSEHLDFLQILNNKNKQLQEELDNCTWYYRIYVKKNEKLDK